MAKFDRSEEKEAGKVGKALYVSSKRQLKKTSRNKSSEYSVQNSLHEASALFYLEFGSLECPGEIGISFFRGAERNSNRSPFFLPTSCTNSTQQWLNLTDNTEHSEPSSLGRDEAPRWVDPKIGYFWSSFFPPFFHTTASNCILAVGRNLIGKTRPRNVRGDTETCQVNSAEVTETGASHQICQKKGLEHHISATKGCSVVSYRRAQPLP